MPYIAESEAQKLANWHEEVDLSSDLPGGSAPEVSIGCENSVAIPGLLHILHNAFLGLGSCMTNFSDTVSQLKHVADLMRQPESKERLLKTCFQGPLGQGLSHDIKAFCGHVYEERWGTVSDCTLQILQCEGSLRHMWSLERYINCATAPGEGDGQVVQGQGAETRAGSVNLEAASNAISDPFFWAFLHMLSTFASMQIRLISWAEGCPCHWSLMEDRSADLPTELKRLCGDCPMRGRRAADLASGKFHSIVQEMCEINAARLVMNLPPTITEAERLTIISDFENGRSHVLFQMALKLSHWEAFPWLTFGASCQDVETSKQILQDLLACECSHPLVEFAKQDHVQDEITQFLADPLAFFCSDDPKYLSNLRTYFATCRMASVVERRIEGKHAAVAKEVKRAPHHGCPYVSLLHRVGEIKLALRYNPGCITDMAEQVQTTRSGLTAVSRLNLDCHPDSKTAKHCRDPAYTRIVYHADPYVKYCMAAPDLSLDKHSSGHDLATAIDSDKCLRQDLAQRHVRAKLRGSPAQSFFSVPVSSGALRTLKELLLPRQNGIVPESTLAFGDIASGLDNGGTVFHKADFENEYGPSVPDRVKKLVFWKLQDSGKNVAMAKREKVPGEQSLSGCLAVSAHTVLDVDVANQQVILSTAPMNISSVASDRVPLVFNPLLLGLKDLESIRVWTPKDDKKLVFRFSWHYLHTLTQDMRAAVPSLLLKMMDKPDGVLLGKPLPGARKLIDQLFRDEMIQEVQQVSDSGTVMSLVKFTPKGAQCVETCVQVTGGEFICKRPPDGVKPLDMTTYEVLLEMELAGFLHRVLSTRESRARKKVPFKHEDPLEWVSKETDISVSHFYLVALLTAAEHGEAVPHFGAESVYKKILGLSCPSNLSQKHRTRSTRMCILGESFFPELELPGEEVAPKKKTRRHANHTSNPKSRPAPLKHGDADVKSQSEDNDDGGQMVLESDKEDSDLSSLHKSPSSQAKPVSESEGSPANSSKPSSSDSSAQSSSSSSSSTASDSDDIGDEGTGGGSNATKLCASSTEPTLGDAGEPGEQAAAAEKVCPRKRKKPDEPRTRGRFAAELWGVFKLTYFDRKGSTGYQMVCTNPKHNPVGQPLCTKSRSDRFAGGTDVCLRMLKQWAIMGADAATKEEHNVMWTSVLASSDLWTEERLEASKIRRWPEPGSASGPSSSSGVTKRTSN